MDRVEQIRERVLNRLRRAEGQMRGIKRLVEEGADCRKIASQIKATRTALDAAGKAWVQLPEWFHALNRDFRYQLTGIGGYAPVYIAEETEGNRFQIAGGMPGLKGSWQVTGIRQDAWANASRIPVESDKAADERGKYLHPNAHGLPEEMGIGYAERQAKKSVGEVGVREEGGGR